MSKHEKGHFIVKRGLYVEVRNNNVDGAIRTLNRKIKQEGTLRDLRRHEYYEPPSVKKRRKAAEARRRALKARDKQQDA